MLCHAAHQLLLWCSDALPLAACSPPASVHLPVLQVTAEGHAAHGMNYDVLQPLTRQRVETWADFSARLPSQPVSWSSARHGFTSGWLLG